MSKAQYTALHKHLIGIVVNIDTTTTEYHNITHRLSIIKRKIREV